MIRFIGLYDTACDYIWQFTNTNMLSVHSNVSIAIAWSWLSTFDDPLPLGSRTVPGLSYNILTATAQNKLNSEAL
jgi:hypothetical protein